METLTTNKQQKTKIQWEAIPYTVPFLEEERHILVIRRE
jgi:hypothetical protein